ncbi:MAG TPA: winged helix-turn-helix domain-containing protein [Pyrinomonadaceae bacterium]|jgi:DNA-binding winged helix-turn-helix (wHTH) protein/tetratricopeptide (TPR) repeat protein
MPHTNNACYEFGPYHLNVAERVLTRSGETIPLTPKASEILVLLVTNAGQLLEKDDLLREVWPDTFVEDSNLTQNIFTLRRALGDERAGPKYIETVTRRGYRFVASVKICDGEHDDAAEVESVNGDEVLAPLVVAVLPFINTTGEVSVEYLAEGVTDNIINNLSRVSRLRVLSRSAVFRRKRDELDPQRIGKELGAKAVLVGTINVRPAGMAITVELVDVATGWQLWGESFDTDNKDLLQIQDDITRHLLVNLKLKLTGEEEKRVTARYTENANAYQAYLEGRYHWSRYTRKGIEKAIRHFRQAIELDPNYALAYAGIVDCYLRLATNYLPPEDEAPFANFERPDLMESVTDVDPKMQLRFEWDWKGAERELRRANEMKSEYPAAHQWYAAYLLSQEIYKSSGAVKSNLKENRALYWSIPFQITLFQPTRNEQIQVFCAIAREQIDAGNYDAACKVLEGWWVFGEWPKLDGLTQRSCADLLFTTGELAGCVASAKQLPNGQKHGEALLNGSIGIFERLSCTRQAAEARIEVALCYYREGLFDLGRSTLMKVLDRLSPNDSDLRSLALIRLASLERHAGRLKDALGRLNEARTLVKLSGPWATGRCHLELASTYKDLAVSESSTLYSDIAEESYLTALREFEAVGSHRLVAIVENNLGFLLSLIGRFQDAEMHLFRARKIFSHFDDRIRRAQVDDSLARLYLAQNRLDDAQTRIRLSIQTMESGDEDALLAESLTTKGMIYCRLQRYNDAQKALEAAYRLALRCGDVEGAGRSQLVLVEEMAHILEPEERGLVRIRLMELLSASQQTAIRERLGKCFDIIDSLPDVTDGSQTDSGGCLS